MSNHLKTILDSSVIAVIVGALLTFYLGGVISNQWSDNRANENRRFELAKNKYNERIKFLEHFSTIAQKRLYKMKQVYWTTKKVKGVPHYKNYEERRAGYRKVKNEWNEELFKNYSLASVLFDVETKNEIEQLHNEMRVIHDHLSVIRLKKDDEFVRYRNVINDKLGFCTSKLRKIIEDLYQRSLNDKEPNE